MKRIYTLVASIFFNLSLIQAQAPVTQASGILISPLSGSTTSMRFDWTNGSGTGRLVVIKNATGNFTPINGAIPTVVSSDFTVATDQDGSTGGVAKVVHNGAPATVDVTNLAANTTYYIQVYEWNTNVPNPTYSVVTNSSNPVSFRYYTSTSTFTTPSDVTSLTVQTWGGGGAGGGNNFALMGGGGAGGGAYSSANLSSLSSSTSYDVEVGTGGTGVASSNGGPGTDSYFRLTSPPGPNLVLAKGGGFGFGVIDGSASGDGGAAGAGGAAGSGVGTVKFSGGNGGAGRTEAVNTGRGGGGGSSGASYQAGVDGIVGGTSASAFGDGGVLPTNGGGSGGTSSDNAGDSGNPGFFPGGGGSGSSEGTAEVGGNGAGGLVIVSFNDLTAPTVTSIVRQAPTAAYIKSTITSVTFRVTFNENVNRVDVTDFTLSGTAVGTSVVNAVTPVSGSVYDVVITSTGTGNGTLDLDFAGGQNIIDISNNAFGGTTSGDQIYTIDNTAPTALQVGDVLTVGGNIVGGFYNNTNTGITVSVPIDNEASLVGGNIQLRIDDDGNSSYNDLGGPVTITASNTDQVVSISEAQLLAIVAEFAEGNTITFTAIVTDAAGNSNTFTASGTTLVRAENAPTTPTVPDLDATSDLGSSSTDNVTNDNTPTFNVTATGSAGMLLQIREGSNVIAFTNSATGALEQLTSSTLSDNASYSITARVTNAAGSIATSAAMTPVLNIDTAPPAAAPVPDLLTASDVGLSTSDNITNDATPTFVNATAGTPGVVVTINSNVDGNLGTGTITAGNNYTIVSRIPKTGTITAATSGNTVVGIGTSFLTELTVGRQIYNATGATLIGTIASITDDNNLILTANASNNIGGLAYSQGLSEGNHTITATTTDLAGNIASTTALTPVLTIDTDFPGVTSIAYVASPSKGLVFRTGTISTSTSSANVTGSGTSFLSELFVGAILRSATDQVIGTVLSITDDDDLILTGNATTAINAAYAILFYFTVNFDEEMNSSTIVIGDFVEAGTGTIGTLLPVTPGTKSQSYYVFVSSLLTDNGTTQINLTGDHADIAGNSSSADFTGSVATIDNAGPTVSSIVRTTPTAAYSQATTVTYTVTFSEPATGVDAADFTKTIAGGGFTAGTVTVNPLSSTVYEVEVASIATVNGTLRLDVLGGATIIDGVGNALTVPFNTGEVYTFDYTNPAAPSVVNVLSTVGRVRPYYYNLTNTGVDVTVQIANDPSLNGGSVQIMARLLPSGTFADVGAASTISAVNTTKVVSLTAADLTGYLANTDNIEFAAKITDQAGNGPIAGTGSAFTITVDLVRPTVSLSPKVYDNKGGGPNNSGATNNNEVIQFTVNEALYNDATVGTITSATNSTAVTGVGTKFTKLVVGGVISNSANVAIGTILSITNDLSLTLTGNAGVAVAGGTFKFRGLSTLLGLTTNSGAIGVTQYISDGTTNTVDGALTNTRLIYVESSANNSGWSTSTNLIYTQSAGGSTAGNYLYDAAGNELNSFSLTCTSGDVIPPALSPNVMTLYPRAGNPEKIVFTLSEALSTSTADNAVTGFSTSTGAIGNATYSEASPGVCPCTITLTSSATGDWTSSTLVSYALTGNVLDLAAPANELAVITDHVLVVEAIPPSISAVSIPDVAMKVGSVVTATITTANDDGDDVVLTSGTIGGFNLSAPSLINVSPTSKTVQFTVTEGGTDVPAINVVPVLNLVLTDGQGNANVAFNVDITQANDPIDAKSPTISSITNTLNGIYEGALTQTVTVVYNETMKTSVEPAITLSGGSTNWGAQTPSGGTNGWSGATYTATFTHDGTEEDLGLITSSVAVGGAQDAAGNPNLGSATSANFTLDTQKPTVTVTALPALINVANDVLTVTVDYNEEMNIGTTPIVTFNIGAGVSNFSPVAAGAWSNGNKRYTRQYEQLNNLTSATNSVTVTNGKDTIGNVQLSAQSGDFSIDTQAPTVVSVNRVSSQFTNASTVFYDVTFSEAVANVGSTDFTPFIVLNNPTVYPGDVGAITTSDNITFNVEVKNITGDGDIRLNVNTSGTIIDDNNNAFATAFTTGQFYTIDNTPATVQSIVISSTTESWSVANGLSINPNDSASFTVTFSEAVTGVDATDFTITNTAPAQLSIGGPTVVTGSGTTWTVKLKGLNLISTSASVQFKIDLTDDNSILDLAGLPLGGPGAGDGNFNTPSLPSSLPTVPTYYTALFPEPVDISTTYSLTSANNFSFAFQFVTPAAPTRRITHFIIQLKNDTITNWVDPVDGVYPSGVNDSNFSDGTLGQLVSNSGAAGSIFPFNTNTFGGGNLTSGYNYDIRVLSVSYSGLFNGQQQLDYLTSTALNGVGNTTTGSNGTVTSTTTAGTISSTVTASTGVPVYTFTLNEDGTGATKSVDNAPTKFSRLIFKPGATNNVGNWTTAIAGAQLTDSEGNVISGLDVSINATDITFNNIPSSNSTQLGYLADNEDKQFTLRIWLQNSLGVADNSRLDFRVDNTSFPLFDDSSNDQISSKLAVTAAESGTVKIDVHATKLVFVTNPQPTIGVGINFNQSTQAQPRIEARDATNNLDLDYNAAFTVTPATGVVTSLTNFTSGVLTLSTFNFSTSGSRTITISGNAVATPIVYVALTGAGVEAVSTSVNAIISNKTTISEATLAPAAERDFIPSITNATPAFFNFDFTITDDVAVDLTDHIDDDALPTLVQTITITRGANNGTNASPGPDNDAATFDEWTRSIAGAQLKAVGNVQTVSGTVNNGSLVFTIPAGTFMENIPNNGSLTYELRIWLQNPVDIALRDILDNKDFAFAINQGNISVGAANTTSTMANSSASTGDGRNVVTVTATQLDFTTQWAALATQNYDAALSPAPVAKARDANQNLDLNYNTAAGVTAFDSNLIDAKTYPLVNSAVTVTNGLITFNAALQVASSGNGTHNDVSRLVLTSGALTNGNSNSFTLTYSGSSDIVRDASFTHPTDIQSINNREASNLTAANSIPLDRFLLRDGGSSNDTDGSKTKLQSISLNVTSHQNIRRIGIYDESGVEIQERDSLAFDASGNITFSTFANLFEANDDDRTTKLLTVRASFRAFVTDNQQINVSVTAATAGGVSSQLIPITIAGDNLGTDKNKIEVVATKIDFTTIPVNASISVPFSPVVVVSARDVFANLDVDYNGTISATETNPSSDLLFHTINNPAGSFSGGQFTYPTNFQFDVGDGNVQLTINAGAGSGANNINAGAIAGTSSIISVLSSFESTITNSLAPQDINYINFQDADITGSSNGFTLNNLQLKDGGADLTDIDGAPTSLDDLILGISNPQSIQKIAVFTHNPITLVVTEIQEQANAAISVTNGYGQITFSNLNITAPDNGYINIWILATFNNSVSNIQDRDTIQVSVLDATLNTGSRFAPDAAETGTIGGVTITTVPFPPAATSIQAGAVGAINKIQVTATSLDFVTQPSAYAGINQPIAASTSSSTGIVHARDKFAILDTDFVGSPTTISASATPVSYPVVFTAGVLNLTGMRYNNPGNGTLTVLAGGLNSHIPGPSNIGNSIPCRSDLDVIHVTAIENQGNGVQLVESLKGGTTNNRIFGITFQAPHVHAAGLEPLLNGFSITFKDDASNPYPFKTNSTTIFKFPKFYRSVNGAAPTLLTAADITVTEVASEALLNSNPSTTSKDMIKVVFINKPTLYDGKSYTYYLSVDVDVSVSVGTAPITPYLEDQGFSFPLTNDHIQTTKGSSTTFVKGITRKFASTKPPVLVLTSPINGKLNVNPDITSIELHFDVPVVTFDGLAYLHDRETNDTVAVLTATNGVFVDVPNVPAADAIKTQVVDSINFAFPMGWPGLADDRVYYVTVPKGKFSAIDVNDRAGISDEGFNLYGGISYNGTFYFKTSSPNPPVLLATNDDTYFYTPSTVTFNAKFDQAGKAYFMVVTSAGAPATVTKNQILGLSTYSNSTVIKRDSVVINQVSPNFQFITVNANLTAGVGYSVYMFAANDAEPTPIQTTAPYGAFVDDGATQNPLNDFVVGANGPTLTLMKPLSGVTRFSNPNINICSNSYALIEEPIIISELTNNEFDDGFATTNFKQRINVLLPSGFQFDVTKKPKLKFNGSDFLAVHPDSTSRFINTTILEITFINTASGSLDNIILSDFYVIASSSDISGPIRRFSGNGILAEVPDLTELATISAVPATTISFTNSYSDVNRFDLAPLNIAKTVTYIPDNYVDEDGTSTVRLIPKPGVGDYGASFFSGSGLTNDILTLSAVSLNTAFNITLTHTDQNGCVSNLAEQYAVYDHTSAIPELLPDPDNDKDIRIAISNPNFGKTTNNGNPPPMLQVADSVSFVGQAGYRLIDLFAKIPSKATPLVDVVNLANNLPSAQLIHGPSWLQLVQNIPVINDSFPDVNLGVVYKTYNWEYSSLLHDDSLSSVGLPNPYVIFADTTASRQTPSGTIPGQPFFTGGSLGLIEFTGKYQSTADFSVFIPFRQEVEIFIPAIPVIEVSGESAMDNTTPIFCEGGGTILLNGYPAASATSNGYFVLRDSMSGANIYNAAMSITPPGFIDNGNGTANLNLANIFNGYKTIRVDYTYQDNNSPAVGTGSFYIRVTPNPVADFSAISVLTARNPIDIGRPSVGNAYCEDNLIRFDNASTFPSGPETYLANTDPVWDIGVPSSLNQFTDSAVYTYTSSGRYIVTFSVKSQYNCPSQLASDSIYIGAIPEAAFGMNGISVVTPINVADSSTVIDGPGTNSEIFSAEWVYSPVPTDTVANAFYTFAVPGHHTITLVSTTDITNTDEGTTLPGCERTFTRPVIIVPNVTSASIGIEITDNFDSPGPLDEWQTSSLDPLVSSWERGNVTESSSSPYFTTNVWATDLDSVHNAGEVSYLYSPSYDLSQLDRPKVGFDQVTFMDLTNNDGVVLEFSTDTFNIADPLKKWYRLGTNADGNNWYNDFGLASKPGTQIDVTTGNSSGDYGWTAQLDTMVHSQHTLSPDLPSNNRTHVIFRFALASLPGSSNLGFAFDNFRVGERTRMVLIENFSNLGNTLIVNSKNIEKRESDFLKDNFPTVGTDVVKLNYHVGFPGMDPFNIDYPADPSARALFYNINETPLSRMDGHTLNDPQRKYISEWGEEYYNVRTLQLAEAELQLTVTPLLSGTFKVKVKVTAKITLPLDTTILHIAFAEKLTSKGGLNDPNIVKTGEDDFEYVVKEMVPNALGTRLSQTLDPGDTLTIGSFEWTPDLDKLYDNNDDLVVVAFLQNEITHQVYQATISGLLADPSAITGIEDPEYAQKINIFPNPVSTELTIQLPTPATEAIPVILVDTYGRTVYQGSFKAGEQQKQVSMIEFAGGVYFVQIATPGGSVARRKVMVVHR